jgi:hypothetical protein
VMNLQLLLRRTICARGTLPLLLKLDSLGGDVSAPISTGD